jgi:HD-GYP domain-containing protein (c-di-GMP phosphodiesterase class II)
MTTDRIYRTKIGVAGAVAEIHKNAGVQFDPALVEFLVEAHRTGRVGDGMPEQTPSLHELIDQIR